MSLSICTSGALPATRQTELRRLMDAAYEGCFTDDDWQNALGGTHVLIDEAGGVVAHGAVVPRRLIIDGLPLKAGYIEAVAVSPPRQGSGLGAQVMQALATLIDDRFEIGVLSTGIAEWYERLGWQRWRGPTWVLHPDGTLERTPEEDDGVLVLRTTRTPPFDLTTAIICDDRPGDAW